MQPVRKAIITDAGFASRYLPITKTVPKAMLPLGNRPIMQFIVEECAQAGIEEIIIVATPEGKPIYEDYFNNGVNRIRKQLAAQGKEDRYEPVQHVLDFPKIVVITQDASLPYGNGSPVASAQKFVEMEEAFLVLYSDDIVFGEVGDAKSMVDLYAQNEGVAGIIMAAPIPSMIDSPITIIPNSPASRITASCCCAAMRRPASSASIGSRRRVSTRGATCASSCLARRATSKCARRGMCRGAPGRIISFSWTGAASGISPRRRRR